MKFSLLQIVIIAKRHTSEHFLMNNFMKKKVRLEKRFVFKQWLIASVKREFQFKQALTKSNF